MKEWLFLWLKKGCQVFLLPCLSALSGHWRSVVLYTYILCNSRCTTERLFPVEFCPKNITGIWVGNHLSPTRALLRQQLHNEATMRQLGSNHAISYHYAKRLQLCNETIQLCNEATITQWGNNYAMRLQVCNWAAIRQCGNNHAMRQQYTVIPFYQAIHFFC